ncbi:MAG TPA: SRPBCC family protein [Chloroflexota bacterium]
MLFVGLPAFIAVALTLTASPRTLTGVVITVASLAGLIVVLLGAPFFAVGLLCLVIGAVPIVAVAAIVWAVVRLAKRGGEKAKRWFGLAPIALMSLEGVGPLSFPAHSVASHTVVVQAGPAAVEAQLARAPRFDGPPPGMLAFGFPRPVSAAGQGLAPGDTRRVRFDRKRPGTLDLVVEAASPGEVTFRVTDNQTKIAEWMAWRRGTFRWRQLGEDETEVTAIIEYDRLLSPAWYFAPLEHNGNQLAAEYVLQTFATPRP